ncbi:hypothetical protein FHS39_002567 [Streptomyces olivoverticillatus]|uniref:Uncharacterized protein n=1 Tax=Streptomyces olivoverticillatus TaxID=66427 RepID=A0A7W7LPR4_9ACTN|nr:hypothetical protein [Streptomyces olivoverticillatus]MBB4893536.1 hypothetical protein [Streptomyces olivoverticillatus]
MSQPAVWAERPAAWPKGVIARYLTRAGEALRDPSITVDVVGGGEYHENNIYRCRACGSKSLNSGTNLIYAEEQAHAHAEKCRAVPRPEGV